MRYPCEIRRIQTSRQACLVQVVATLHILSKLYSNLPATIDTRSQQQCLCLCSKPRMIFTATAKSSACLSCDNQVGIRKEPLR